MLIYFGGGRKYLQEFISHNKTNEGVPPIQRNKPLIIRQLTTEIDLLYFSQYFRILNYIK